MGYFDPSGYACEAKERAMAEKKAIYDSLENIDNFQDGALEHIFEGNTHINKMGDEIAGGYHYNSLPDSNGKIIRGTKTDPDIKGLYEAEVKINKIRKKGGSTFFPDKYTPQEIVNMINKAYDDIKDLIKPGRVEFLQLTEEKIKLRIVVNPYTKKIKTAYTMIF